MKHFAKKFTRVLALALAAGQLTLSLAGAAFSNAFSYSYPVGEGLTYTRTEGKNATGLQKANVLTYTPNGSVTPVIAYTGDQLYGSKSTILNAVKYLGDQGKRVIGGVNADFFVLSTGIPIGLVIDEGELVSSDAWQYAVGFRADGSAVLGQPTMDMKITGASGAVSVSYFNKTRTTAGAYLLDHNYDDSSNFTANGTSIVLERVDDTPVRVNKNVKMKVVDKKTGNAALSIAENQMVLTKSDGANVPSWKDFAIGEEVTLSVYSANNAWSEVQYAVGGKQLVKDGVVTTSGIDAAGSKTARTAVGVKADGTVVVYEVDGLQSSHSAGLTAAELGQEMVALGCVSVVCLDGGGSSAMALRQPGESSATLASKPSDGSQRACANYIFFVNNVAPDGVTARAVLTPSVRYLLPNGSTYFSVKGADAAYETAPAPTDLAFTVSDNLGTVDGQTFTAGSETGIATVTGTNGAVSGSMTVCITGDVQSIVLQSGDEEIGSLSVKPGQSVQLSALAYRAGQKMGATNSSFTWSVTGDIGTVENGLFTAGSNMSSGTLTASYGAVKKTINVNVGMGDAQGASQIADFEASQPLTATEGVQLSLVDDYTVVARGERSLMAGFDGSKVQTGTLSVPPTDVSAMNYLSLYAKAANANLSLTAVFTDEAGGEVTAPLSAAPTSAWKLLQAAVPEQAKMLTGIRFERQGEGQASAALYLDQIVLTADHAIVNTDAPAFQLAKSALSVNANAAATITGTATMENGKYPVRAANVTVKVDGKPVAGAAKMSGSSLTVTTGALAAGTHCVTIDVTDDAGNRTRRTATVTAGSGGASPFADTAGHWSEGYAALLHTNGIMKGETSGGKTYFNPTRNLSRVEFAVTMARVLNLDTSYSGKLDFADDASIPSWARGAVYAVSQAGIMAGQQSGGKLLFSPNASITRAEVMTVIGRSLPRGFSAAALPYSDASSVPNWAAEPVKTCVTAGVIGGYSDNTLRPNNKITRGEIAKVLALL